MSGSFLVVLSRDYVFAGRLKVATQSGKLPYILSRIPSVVSEIVCLSYVLLASDWVNLQPFLVEYTDSDEGYVIAYCAFVPIETELEAGLVWSDVDKLPFSEQNLVEQVYLKGV